MGSGYTTTPSHLQVDAINTTHYPSMHTHIYTCIKQLEDALERATAEVEALASAKVQVHFTFPI